MDESGTSVHASVPKAFRTKTFKEISSRNLIRVSAIGVLLKWVHLDFFHLSHSILKQDASECSDKEGKTLVPPIKVSTDAQTGPKGSSPQPSNDCSPDDSNLFLDVSGDCKKVIQYWSCLWFLSILSF